MSCRPQMTLAPWGKPLDVATWSMGGASCAQLFGPVTLGRLGDSPSCSAPFGRKLLVLLGRGATVAPGAAQIRCGARQQGVDRPPDLARL